MSSTAPLHGADTPRVFNIPLFRPLRLACLMLSPLMLLPPLAMFFLGEAVPVVGLFTGLLGTFLLVSALTASTVRLYRLEVDTAGIAGRDNWLIRRRVTWGEIASVTPMLVPGYPYLLLSTRTRKWLFWVPLFLTDMAGFRDAVRAYATPENPLRRFLDGHLEYQ